MVALLDKPEAVAVQHCIGQIAECYPQALVYALMISSESYRFEDSATGHKQQEFVNRLKLLMWGREMYLRWIPIGFLSVCVCVSTGSGACWIGEKL